MSLRGGQAMHMQLAGLETSMKHHVQFIGVLPSISFITTIPFQNGKPIWLRPGVQATFRVLMNTHVYAFKTTSVRAHSRPGGYAHFLLPETIHSRSVRSHTRVEMLLPVEITRPDKTRSMAILHDISLRGATLEMVGVLGSLGDHLGIDVPLIVPELTKKVSLSAVVRNCSDYLPSIERGRFRYGIEFVDVNEDDSLLLHYFIDHIIAELHANC
jgi:hypothetical protein